MLQCLYNYERKISQIILWKKTKITKGMVSEVDPIAIRKLYYEYRMTNQEISDMTWETKANINKILNQGIKYYNPWIEHYLTEQLHQSCRTC